MDDVERLLDRVDRRARYLLNRAHIRMAEGAPIAYVMERFVRPAFNLFEEADVQAHLAAAGDEHARTVMEACLAEIESLIERLDAEFPAQEEGAGGEPWD